MTFSPVVRWRRPATAHQTKLLRHRDEVAAIERHNCIRPAVHPSFQHHVVIGVGQRRSPKKVEQNRLRDRRHGVEQNFDVRYGQS